MVWPQGLLPDRQRPLVKGLGLGILALVVVKNCKVVQARSYLGVVCAQGLLPDRQRPLVERFGFGILALVVVDNPEVVQARGHLGAVWPKVFSRIFSARL